MRFSLQVQYAICGCFDLAYNGDGQPIQIRVISERQEIPSRYLGQIFQRLRRAGLVHSRRGPGGGYVLAKPAVEITLRELVEAVEGSIAKALRMDSPSDSAPVSFRPDFLWGALAEQVADVLSATTLDALCRRAVRERVARAQPDAPMYFI